MPFSTKITFVLLGYSSRDVPRLVRISYTSKVIWRTQKL